MKRYHPCYRGRRSFKKKLAESIRRTLSAGPWFWPTARDVEQLQLANRLMGDALPAAQPGQIPLVAYHPRGNDGSVWLLELNAGEDSSEISDFATDALQSWYKATIAVPRSTPLLWRSLAPLAAARPQARFVGSQGHRSKFLADRSFGLAFGLAIVSRLTGSPLPIHYAASATLDEQGKLGEVGGLSAKIAALLDFAPRVTHLIVAKKQANEAREIAAGRLTILGFDHLTDALNAIFDLPAELARWAEDPDARAELIDEIFRLTMSSSSVMVDWSPVGRAAELIAEHSPSLSAESREKLSFAHAVATRHTNNRGELKIPDLAWFERLPAPLRLDMVAHIVQQSADSAQPDPKETLAFAAPYIKRSPDAFPAHLKLLGALGRLHFNLGDHTRALQLQQDAIAGWIELREFKELSHPLSFALLIAGALGDSQRLNALMDDAAAWYPHSDPKGVDRTYIDLARGRALCQTGDLTAAKPFLQSVLDATGVHQHVTDGALRWLVFCLESTHKTERAEALLNQYAAHLNPDQSALTDPKTKLVLLLIELDRALRRKDAPRAEQFAERVIEDYPQFIKLPLDHQQIPPEDRPIFVQRFLPYY